MGHESLPCGDADFPATEAAPLDALFTPSQHPAIEDSRPPAQPPVEDQGAICTFLYARLHNFVPACSTVAGPELTAFVNEARRVLSSAALKLGGEIAQRRPDSILCAFTHNREDRIPTHAKRGLHAAILTVHEAMQLGARVGPQLEAAGVRFSGLSPDGLLPEIIELPDHPWFIGVQFHPEFTSNPRDGHPLFTSFVRAAREHAAGKLPRAAIA